MIGRTTGFEPVDDGSSPSSVAIYNKGVMYYLIARFQNRKASDYVLACSMKKDKEEITQLLIKYRDTYGFTEKSGYNLYIKKI